MSADLVLFDHETSPPRAGSNIEKIVDVRAIDRTAHPSYLTAIGEDVEDKLRAVDHSDIDYLFDIALLRGGEVVVKQNQIGRHGGYRCCNLRQLPASDQRRRVRTVSVLQEVADNFGARTSSQSLEFVERFFGGKFRDVRGRRRTPHCTVASSLRSTRNSTLGRSSSEAIIQSDEKGPLSASFRTGTLQGPSGALGLRQPVWTLNCAN